MRSWSRRLLREAFYAPAGDPYRRYPRTIDLPSLPAIAPTRCSDAETTDVPGQMLRGGARWNTQMPAITSFGGRELVGRTLSAKQACGITER
jgi:hypothetical protein